MKILLVHVLLLTVLTIVRIGDAATALQKAPCILDYTQLPHRSVFDVWDHIFNDEVAILGHGTTGRVSLVHSTNSDALVAVKTFANPTRGHQFSGECSSDTEHVRNILLEHHVGHILNEVSGVTQTLDLIHDTSSCTWHLILEHVPQSLAKQREILSHAQKIRILKQIAATIQDIHRLGIAHGDIKLENVLLTDNLDPRLIDFGSSTFSHCPIESPIDDNGVLLSNVVPGDYGTVPYMPPEVFQQLEYDRQKADIWSLGILALVMWNHKVPWKFADESDPDWRIFMGWEEVDGDCQALRKCCMTQTYDERRSLFGACISPAGRSSFWHGLPVSIVSDVARWLAVSPSARFIS